MTCWQASTRHPQAKAGVADTRRCRGVLAVGYRHTLPMHTLCTHPDYIPCGYGGQDQPVAQGAPDCVRGSPGLTRIRVRGSLGLTRIRLISDAISNPNSQSTSGDFVGLLFKIHGSSSQGLPWSSQEACSRERPRVTLQLALRRCALALR
jgi:hypothetical protein